MTLVELVVVLVIIMALAASSLVLVNRVTEQSFDATTDRKLETLREAVYKLHPDDGISGFLADMGRLPQAPELLLYDKYMTARSPVDDDVLLQWTELTEGVTYASPVTVISDDHGGSAPDATATRQGLVPWGRYVSAVDNEVAISWGWRGPYVRKSGLKDGWDVPFRCTTGGPPPNPINGWLLPINTGFPTTMLGGVIGGAVAQTRAQDAALPYQVDTTRYVDANLSTTAPFGLEIHTKHGMSWIGIKNLAPGSYETYFVVCVTGPNHQGGTGDPRVSTWSYTDKVATLIPEPPPLPDLPAPPVPPQISIMNPFPNGTYIGQFAFRVYRIDSALAATLVPPSDLGKWVSPSHFATNDVTKRLDKLSGGQVQKGPIHYRLLKPGVTPNPIDLSYTFP